jgi:UDP-N-acetylglucosamine transferase subunit ALG13
MEEFMTLVGEAELIVCHAGAGTLLHVLNAGKVPVVMPRRAKYGEVIDDHQLELVTALAEQRRIVPALEAADLVCAIEKARQMQARPIPGSAPMMVNLVSQAVEELLGTERGDRSVIRRHKSAA